MVPNLAQVLGIIGLISSVTFGSVIDPVTVSVTKVEHVTKTVSKLAIGGGLHPVLVQGGNGNGINYVVTSQKVAAKHLVDVVTVPGLDCPTLTVSMPEPTTSGQVNPVVLANKRLPSQQQELARAVENALKQGLLVDLPDNQPQDLSDKIFIGN